MAALSAEQQANAGAAVIDRARSEGVSHEGIARVAIQWASEQFGDRLGLLSSMADEALVHLAAEAAPGIDVVFLDTGYHFAETLGTRDAYAASANITLLNVTPVQSVPQQDAQYGERLYERDPNQCCAMRKVEPLNRALQNYDCWISGMRREDSATRLDIGIIEYDAKRDKVKVNPLADWDSEQVTSYIETNHVMLNPLRQLGFDSIGCEPCTKLVAPGDDPRSGRWAGTNKIECGLHE
ncbi:MAG: phosphoadenylyl-sulfate reductase [Actinobacteria bacterium]|nr:phosphoadenylyl-sulfate reductase [Actinomycetota bacterium]